MPKTGMDSEQFTEKIIVRAEEKIRAHGFHRFTLSDLARDLNVTHAALYRHVAGKDALLDLISMKWLARIDEELERVTRESLEPEDLIIKWFSRYYALKREKVSHDPEIYKTFNMAVEAEKPFVQQHLAELTRQLTGLVEKAAAQGWFSGRPAAQTVGLLFDATTAFHHPYLVAERKDENRIDELTLLLRTMMAGLSDRENQ